MGVLLLFVIGVDGMVFSALLLLLVPIIDGVAVFII